MAKSQEDKERQTRKKRIDPRLDAAEWRTPPQGTSRVHLSHRSEDEPTANGSVDYALWLDNRIVGVVVAKRLSVDSQNALVQAEQYARGLEKSTVDFGGFRAPFLYSTNGEQVWFHDVRHPQNGFRRVAGFHTPSALREALLGDQEQASRRLLALPNTNPFLRPYQVDANAAVEKAIAESKRAMLLAMPTGTGKTFTLVNQLYRLIKSGVSQRIPFPVDRGARAAQAVRAFSSFEAEPIKLLLERPNQNPGSSQPLANSLGAL